MVRAHRTLSSRSGVHHARCHFFLLLFVFVRTTSGQDSAPSQSTPVLEPIAVVSILVVKHNFKSGQDIDVTVLLEAGRGGVYIPRWWGDSGGGIPGFSVSLTTLSGNPAETCGIAADAAWPKPEPDAAVVLKRDFIFLPARHIIGVKTAVGCPTKRRGKYLINAFYSPYHIDAERVAQLPETNGRVLQKGVTAKPVMISIY
jgi:hypothetical protein